VLLDNPNLKRVIFKDPYLKKSWSLTDNTLIIRGTVGVGDLGLSLSTAFYIANLLKTKIHLIYYWTHDEFYQHTPEDPETIIEKLKYLHSLCYKSEIVTYENVFNADHDMFNGQMLLNIEREGKMDFEELNVPDGLNSWKFKPHIMNKEISKRKVSLWRYNFNSYTPPTWKRSYKEEDWQYIMDSLKRQGWQIQELCYRTPIREALYHIQTSRFCVGYDGMWHYLARMLYKPTIITGDSTIVNVHNPQCMPFYSPNKDKGRRFDFRGFIDNLDSTMIKLDSNCERYKNKVDKIIEDR